MDLFIHMLPKKQKPVEKTSPQFPSRENMNPKDMQKFVMETHEQAMECFQKKYYRKSLEAFELLLKLGVDKHGCLMNIGTIWLVSEHFDRAIDYLGQAIDLDPSDPAQYGKMGEAQFGGKKYDLARKSFEKANIKSGSRDFNIWIAKCYFEDKRITEAFNIVKEIIEKGKDYLALLLYCEILISQHSPAEDVLPILLNLLTQDRHSRVKELIAEIVEKHGVSMVIKVLGPQATPQILTFIASVIKEFGVIQECIELYEIACKTSNNPSHWLNWAHCVELTLNYTMVVKIVTEFTTKFGNLTVGGLTCSNVLELLNGTKPMVTYKIPKSYTPDELNLLAFFFTLVKVSYLQGELVRSKDLVEILTPLQIDDLHTTIIRNENAYFSQISSLIAKFKSIPKISDFKPIYICGDSHCLSPAWNIVKGDTILIPKLVTGLKCWHLRNESKFYPKRNFEFAVKSIPEGSKVIFMFGEIDCREGILLAMEKLKYESLQEGTAHVIDIYLDTLKKLNKFDLVIHPVLPVIDVTRHNVTVFNQILKEKCKAKGFVYLDFMHDLIEGGKLKKQYELDGTHIDPSYLLILEKHLK